MSAVGLFLISVATAIVVAAVLLPAAFLLINAVFNWMAD